MSDKPNMPYTQSVIHEVQRQSDMIPLLGTHKNNQDITVKGVNLSSGTVVYGQIWSIMNDDSVFEENHKFNPSRYLQADGKMLNKTYAFIPNSNIDLSPDWGAVLTSKPYTYQLIPQTLYYFVK
ncbi:Protein CBG05273 [Caenorhabditis briggsae]|uniref:Protein CBG05273 n=1 Tax=Caenorhabditis briggsae TaxID=6238 RepID=A8WZI4_CAEBR|nr:Protein CBG05273 [Caenorhabditis briggsae]CAP25794.2 Protein CBG05273 [Caenorhabditis briggsae]